jgi:hypothetical protein
MRTFVVLVREHVGHGALGVRRRPSAGRRLAGKEWAGEATAAGND